MREILGKACAAYYFIRSRGRMRGSSYLVGRPSRLRIERGGSLEVGRGVVIERGARIIVRSKMRIAEGAYIGKNATIIAFDEVHIGADALLGENVSVHTEDHGPAGRRLEFSVGAVTIGRDAWLCAGVVVTKGCSVGDNATVGANAVVTRDVPPNVTAVGVPARSLLNKRNT